MAEIRFWKWQQTDEFGMPCATRIRISAAGAQKIRAPELDGNDVAALVRRMRSDTAPPASPDTA
jgi:hypothetical protein